MSADSVFFLITDECVLYSLTHRALSKFAETLILLTSTVFCHRSAFLFSPLPITLSVSVLLINHPASSRDKTSCTGRVIARSQRHTEGMRESLDTNGREGGSVMDV